MLTRLLGFVRLDCGCLASRYRDSVHARDVRYVEDRGAACRHADHQRHQVVLAHVNAATASPHYTPAA